MKLYPNTLLFRRYAYKRIRDSYYLLSKIHHYTYRIPLNAKRDPDRNVMASNFFGITVHLLNANSYLARRK